MAGPCALFSFLELRLGLGHKREGERLPGLRAREKAWVGDLFRAKLATLQERVVSEAE